MVWQKPRLLIKGPDGKTVSILLRDLKPILRRVEVITDRELGRSAAYLAELKAEGVI